MHMQGESVTQNDAYIVDSLLERPDADVYDMLVGRDEVLPHWPTGAQERAQDGICSLIQTEYEPYVVFRSREQGVRAMRRSLSHLTKLPTYHTQMTYGRQLEYQTIHDPEAFGTEYDDYLHFGIRRKSDAAVALPSPRRIYVNTSIDGGGEIATRVIRHARLNGVEPYGKVLDQSTKARDVSLRKDGLLFVADTQQELDAIINGLRQAEQNCPELFNDDSVLMAEPAGIRGVGFADEPPKSDLKLSFTERAEALVQTAWNAALDTLPATMLEHPALNNSLWGREQRAKQANLLLQRGQVAKAELVQRFGEALRQTAPRFGVSSSHISRNAL